MRALYITVVCAALASGTWACKGDPTADLRNGPASISLVPGQIFIDTGKATSLLVAARDEQLNTLAGDLTVSSADPAIVKVEVDTTRPVVDGARHAFVVSGINPGHTRLNVTASGLADTIPASTLPITFPGAISTLTPTGGDTMTIQSTTLLAFDPDSVTVIFPGDVPATRLSASANSVTLLAPFAGAGQLTIAGVAVTYVTNLDLDLPTVATVQTTGDQWAGDSSWQTAPDLTGMLPAPGDTIHLIATSPATNNAAVCADGGVGPCVIFAFTLADTATFRFRTDWIGTGAAPDIDIYACSDSTVANQGTACFESGGGGATANNPEAIPNFKYSAGTHYFVMENFDGVAPKNLYVTVTRP